MKAFAICVLTSLFLFLACQKHLDVNGTAPITPVPPIPLTETDVIVTASVQGRVTDQTGAPVKDATVTSGTNSVQTDINGIFHFSGIQTSKYFGYIKVSKTGFFTGSRIIVTSTTGVNYIVVELLPRTSSGSFDAATGATITSTTGNSVIISGNSVVTASSNTAYAGTVNVFSSWIDPTDPKRNSRMPGDLRGTDTSNRTAALQSFGMVAIELEGSAGEKLQIAPGKTATISFPIPAALQSAAPTTTPLWYFNDTTGKWIQQGMAARNGSNYIGTVAHFTYWNCDWPSDFVYFNVNLKDQIGNPLAYARLKVTNTSTNDTQTFYSDSIGNVNGWGLKNTVLSFAVVDNCGTSLTTKSEGPFTSNQDLGTMTVTSNPDQMVTVHGTVVDCSNSPVANGFTTITLDGLNYGAAVTNGSFSATILKCSGNATNLQIQAGDYTTQMLSDTSVLAVTGGDVNAGQLTACSVHFDQYFIYNIDGNTFNITDPPAIFTFVKGAYNSNNVYTELSASSGDSGMPGYQYSFLHIPTTSAGTSVIYMQTLKFGTLWYSAGWANISCTVTRYDSSGGYVQGSFSGGLYLDSTGSPHPMNGSFKVKIP